MFKDGLTAERLREFLHYDPETGVFTRLISRSVRCPLGVTTGTESQKGYRSIFVDTAGYRAHRLAWLYVYGVWPTKQLDHINGIKDDNRIVNLREVTTSENHQNKEAKKSGGAYYVKPYNKWASAITTNKKQKHLGLFDTQEEAHAAYVKAKIKYHEFCPEELRHEAQTSRS